MVFCMEVSQHWIHSRAIVSRVTVTGACDDSEEIGEGHDSCCCGSNPELAVETRTEVFMFLLVVGSAPWYSFCFFEGAPCFLE